MKVIRRIGRAKGFSLAGYECFDNDAGFCLSGNSNGIDLLLYDLEMAVICQFKNTGADWKKRNPIKGILRADLLKSSQNIFMDTFTQVIPFGDSHKKDKAVEIVRKEAADSIMRRRMLRLLTLIPEKKSLHLAQKAMNCRDIAKVMDSFAKINLSPVTISKRHDVKYLECLYTYLLDEE